MSLWGKYHPSYINKCFFLYVYLGAKECEWEEILYNWSEVERESRSERICCFNESDVMKGMRIFKDIHILIRLFRSCFHLLPPLCIQVLSLEWYKQVKVCSVDSNLMLSPLDIAYYQNNFAHPLDWVMVWDFYFSFHVFSTSGRIKDQLVF